MSEQDLATFRRSIGDNVKGEQDIQTTNGQDKTFLLRYDNVFNYDVYLDGELLEDDNSVFTMYGP